jgi:EAL domain-containing protein (putative c-di-GMP-specific phosphodiesterase class I)
MLQITSLAFTIVGIIFLAQALKPAYTICRREKNWGWCALTILISLFILGYGIMAVAVYQSNQADIFSLIVASILLGGSVFVVLVMRLSLNSINQIRHITQQEHSNTLLNERNQALLNRLPGAIAEQEFELNYQPLISTQTNTIHGVECLIRWPQTDGSAIATSDFIQLAEQSHAIVDITRWVIKTSLKQLGQWHLAGHQFALQVNISARDLDESDLPAYIAKHLHSNKIDASHLTLEITEHLFINSQGKSSTILQDLRTMGVGISLDDFGTGYSSMTLLNQLPLSQIKIDQSFVHDMEHDSKKMSIVQSTLDMGKNIGLEVIAEGVENAQQAHLLKQMNCNLIQGYYLAKPMSVTKFEQWLLSQT